MKIRSHYRNGYWPALAMWLWLLLPATASSQSQATAPVFATGRAEVTVQRKPKPEDKARAEQLARINAFDTYFSKLGAADSKRYDALRTEILEEMDYFILSAQVLGGAHDKGRSVYSATVQIQLNINRLRQKMVPEAGEQQEQSRAELAFMFVTRQVAEQKAFDDRVYSRRDVTRSNQATASTRDADSGTTGEAGSNTSWSMSDAAVKSEVSTTRSTAVETGGSRTSRATQRTYRVSSSQSFNAAFLEGLTARDWPFDPVEVETEPSIDVGGVREDFATQEEVQPTTLQALVAQARGAGFAYLVIGTLDVSLPTKDPTLNVRRVAVEINAKVYDIGGRRVKTILTIKPMLVSGFDEDEGRAQAKAIREAAVRASEQFLSQLSNKDIEAG